MIRFSELLGMRLQDGAGKPLGHVVDIRCSGAKALDATFILYGKKSFLERLGVWKRPVEKIPMERVAGIRGRTIKLRG